VKTRVTIGLPTYNSERFLRNTIDAILAQTHKDFTLVINDDGSSDSTIAICREYAARDPRIQFTQSPANRGGAINYQQVFHLSSTEYFRWAAHDDSLAPELLERCIAELDRHPDVVMCYPRAYNIDESGKITGTYEDNFGFDADDPVERFRGVLNGMYGHAGNPMFAVVRREQMAKTALIAPFPSSDMTFLAELSLYGKFREIPDRLYFHRMHPGTSNQLGLTSSEYTAWHDRSRAGKLSFPKWLRFKALVQAVERSPLTYGQKIRCIAAIASYYASIRNVPKIWSQIQYSIRIRRQRMSRPSTNKSPARRKESEGAKQRSPTT
jgi:glycosyltransferase involved in cell wall biosynthesis